jgi:hypothetical protein
MSQSFDELAEAALKQMASQSQTTHGRTVIRKSPSSNNQTQTQTQTHHPNTKQLNSRSHSPSQSASTNPFASAVSSPQSQHITTSSSQQNNQHNNQHSQHNNQHTIATAANTVSQTTNRASSSPSSIQQQQSSQPLKPNIAKQPPEQAVDQLVPLPPAPAEETANAEIAELNDQKIAVLVAQQQANEKAQHSLNHVLQAQFETLTQQQSKLAYIQSELHKLDQSLSENISQLRNEIEYVGREVVQLQHTFDAAQKAFLDSRLALAKKTQRKLLLTGHLNSIILSNEQAKASKLTELQIQMGLISDPNTDQTSKQANGVVAEPVQPSFAGFE